MLRQFVRIYCFSSFLKLQVKTPNCLKFPPMIAPDIIVSWYSDTQYSEILSCLTQFDLCHEPACSSAEAVSSFFTDFVDILFWKDLLWNWSGLEWDLRELYQCGRRGRWHAHKCWWSSHSCNYWSFFMRIFRLSKELNWTPQTEL